MSDVVERAEAVLEHHDTRIGHALLRDLLAALKAARAENERLRIEYHKATAPRDYWGNPL